MVWFVMFLPMYLVLFGKPNNAWKTLQTKQKMSVIDKKVEKEYFSAGASFICYRGC